MQEALLRVLFLGTPDFALPSLRVLARSANVVGVVTQPDRPAGRGRVATPPPVAVAAREMGLRLLQPRSLRSAQALEQIRALQPDLVVTVAYGLLVPGALLALPPLGCVNLHPSLLPQYRGASPIQRAIADGAEVTGVTVMYLTEELDAGDVILQRRIAIGPEETAGELEARLAEEGAALLLEAVGQIARKEAARHAQDHARATYAGKLSKADGAIAWARPARSLVNMIRAMNPWPCAHTTWQVGVLRIWRARVAQGGGLPGQVLGVGEDGITVAAGEGAVTLLEVQPEGGRRMHAAAFARGHRIAAGDRLGEGEHPARSESAPVHPV